MKGLFEDIEMFLEEMCVQSPVRFELLRDLLGPLNRYLDAHADTLESFTTQRLAILIYLAQNYLDAEDTAHWYQYFNIRICRRMINGQEVVATTNNEELADDTDSVCTEHDGPMFDLDGDDDRDPVDINALVDIPVGNVVTLVDTGVDISASTTIEANNDIDASPAIAKAMTEADIDAPPVGTGGDISTSPVTANAVPEADISSGDDIDAVPEKMIAVVVPVGKSSDTKSTQVCQVYDEDYQLYQSIHHLPSHIIEEIYRQNYSTELIHSLDYSPEYIKSRLDAYRAIPQHAQKSIEWLNQRVNCITASALADAIGKKGIQARQNLLLDKVSCGKHKSFSGNFYTRWGEMFEDVASALYCQRMKTELHDFGMIVHPKYSILGASTDGITDQLINLEIKCPPSRVITGHIPKGYWIQIQLQLEVLNLPLSHFLECRFEAYKNADDFYNGFRAHDVELDRGIIIEVWDTRRFKLGLPARTYRYSPTSVCDAEGFRTWYQNDVQTAVAEGQIYLGEVYWYLEKYSCINVQRDFKWFKAHLPLVFKFWEDVERGRERGFENVFREVEDNRTPKSAGTLFQHGAVASCLLGSDDDEVVIRKMPKKIPTTHKTLVDPKMPTMRKTTPPKPTTTPKTSQPRRNIETIHMECLLD
jgi:putative phage-type endonuclease